MYFFKTREDIMLKVNYPSSQERSWLLLLLCAVVVCSDDDLPRRRGSQRLRRMLFGNEGSDCLRAGGGKVPYFESCVGCPVGSAQQCALDMRRNVSANVPTGCELGEIGAGDGDGACCAKAGRRETYAFPDALRCLRNLKCDKSSIYTEIYRECDASCPASHQNIWDAACEPSEFDAAHLARPLLFTLIAPALIGAWLWLLGD